MDQNPVAVIAIEISDAVPAVSNTAKPASATTTPLKGSAGSASVDEGGGSEFLAQKLFPSPAAEKSLPGEVEPLDSTVTEKYVVSEPPELLASQLGGGLPLAEHADSGASAGAGGILEAENPPTLIVSEFESAIEEGEQAGEKRVRSEKSPTGAFETTAPSVKKAKLSPNKAGSPAKKT